METAGVLRALLALATVAVLLAGLSSILRTVRARTVRAGRGGRFLRVLESAVLANGVALHVVAVGERFFVVAAAAGHAQLVCEVAGGAFEAWRAAPGRKADSRNRGGPSRS